MTVTKKNWTGSIIYFVIVMLTLVLRICYSLGLADFVPIDGDYLFTLVVQILIFGLVPFFAYILTEFYFSDGTMKPLKSLAVRFGFTKRVGWKNWLRTIVISILMVFTASFISWMWQSILSALGFVQASSPVDYNNISVLFMQLLMVAVLPGFFEEFTHRGLVFAAFKSNKLRDGWKVVLISALVFSLMHQNIRQTGYTFYDGMIMALLCYYTGSIFPAIFAHFFNNAVSVVSGYIEQNFAQYDFFTKAYNFLLASPAGFAVFLVSFVGGSTLLVFLFFRMRGDFYREQTKLRLKRALNEGAIALRVVDGKESAELYNQNEIKNQTNLENAEINAQNFEDGKSENTIFNKDLDLNQNIQSGSNEKQNQANLNELNVTIEKKYAPDYLLDLEFSNSQIIKIAAEDNPKFDFLPNDFTVDFDKPNKGRKQVWLFVTIAVGIVCAILSFVWGMLR